MVARGLLRPQPLPMAQPPWKRVAVVGLAGALIGLALLALQLVRLGGDPTAPFFVGTFWDLDDALAERGIEVQTVPGTGYDGQWYLGLAYDPLLLDDLSDGFDMPRYRAGRPLLGMAGWLASGGGLLGAAPGILAVGVLAAGLGAAATARLAVAAGLPRWAGLAFCLVPGVAVGVTHATAEPLGLACAALGLSLAVRPPDRLAPAAGLAFAAAALTKETYLLFALAAAAVALLEGGGRLWARVRRAGLLVAPGVALLAVWSGWVALRVPASATDGRPAAALAPPLTGWVDAIGDMVAGTWVADAPVGPLGIGLMVGSLLLAVAGVVAGLRRPGLLGWCGLGFGVAALCLSPYLLGHFLSAMRVLAPSVLAALLGLGAALARPRGAVAGPAGRPSTTEPARP
jgi:hypothetical protein